MTYHTPKPSTEEQIAYINRLWEIKPAEGLVISRWTKASVGSVNIANGTARQEAIRQLEIGGVAAFNARP